MARTLSYRLAPLLRYTLLISLYILRTCTRTYSRQSILQRQLETSYLYVERYADIILDTKARPTIIFQEVVTLLW